MDQESREISEFVRIEYDTITKNLEVMEEINKQPITDDGYKILKELNNRGPEGGLRLYQRGEAKYPSVFKMEVMKRVNLSPEEFESEIKILFFKRFVDYNFSPSDLQVKAMEKNPDLTVDLLKFGTVLDTVFSQHGLGTIRLTDRGFYAMIDYGLKDMIEIQSALDRTKKEIDEKIIQQQVQIDEFRKLSDKANEDLESINSNVVKVEKKVSRFDENIFTIFSLMIAAFAVIGINISSIPNIDGNFFISILVINFSICFSLIVLFYLLKLLIHNEKSESLGRLLFGFGIIFLFVIIFQSEFWSELISNFK